MLSMTTGVSGHTPNPDEPPLRGTGRNQIATDYADYTDFYVI
jgi:hypothetical protein